MLRNIIMLVLFFSVTCKSSSYTLDEVLATTYNHNPELKASREEVKVNDEKIMQAIAGWLPSLNMQVKRELSNKANAIGFGIQQNLFRGGADIAAIKTAKYAIECSRAQLINTEQKILSATVEAYMETIQALEGYKIATDGEKRWKKNLEVMKHKFNAEQNTKIDLALAESNYAQARAKKIDAYANYESMKATFTKLTGLEAKNLSIPVEHTLLPQTLELAITAAINKNPNIISAKNAYEVANSKIGGELGKLLPSINLAYDMNNNIDPRFGTVTNRGEYNSSITLSVDVPIFNGGSSWSEVRKSKKEAKKQIYTLADVRNTVKQGTIVAWQKLKSAKAKLLAVQEQVAAQKIAYEGIIAEEKEGFKNILEVIDITNKYFQVREELLKVRTAYFNSVYILKSQLGECTAKDLGLKVALYNPD